jgi:hypothetical protein
MIKLFLSVTFATALIGSAAYAQTETSSTTTGTAETATTTTESFGTVTDFRPGQTIVLRPETGEPTSYKFSKTVTYVTADGRVIDASKVRKDSKVRVYYLKSGDDMLVDKVVVTERD